MFCGPPGGATHRKVTMAPWWSNMVALPLRAGPCPSHQARLLSVCPLPVLVSNSETSECSTAQQTPRCRGALTAADGKKEREESKEGRRGKRKKEERRRKRVGKWMKAHRDGHIEGKQVARPSWELSALLPVPVPQDPWGPPRSPASPKSNSTSWLAAWSADGTVW